jgi:hypothetical protein
MPITKFGFAPGREPGMGFGGMAGSGIQGVTFHAADPDIAARGEQERKNLEMQNQFKQGRFNQLLPMIQGGMGAGNFSMGGQGITVPQPAGGGPHIQGGPLWTKQGIQQNLNANRAQIDRATATQNQNMSNQLAGRGYGTASPLAFALQNQAAMGAMGQKADYERQFTQDTRQQNARFGLDAAKAGEAQFANRQQEMLGYGQNLLANQRNQIQAQGQAQQSQNQLLSMLAGLL